VAVADKAPLNDEAWAAIGRRLELDERHGQLDLVISALLGAEQIAGEWLGEAELRKRIGAAIAHAMDLRLRVVERLREERRRQVAARDRGQRR
jgi:hypothetical protein